MSKQLADIRHLALDMDGTIYSGGTLFPWTKPFLDRMTKMGIGYTFLTNNSSKSARDY
ncbi:MAG: hydrolase, partial [Verrucomicrobia bacterium]